MRQDVVLFSFCCHRCRKRATSVSVRFFGRRVYLGLAVVLRKNLGSCSRAWHTGMVSWLGNQRLSQRVRLFKFPEGDHPSPSRCLTINTENTIVISDRTHFTEVLAQDLVRGAPCLTQLISTPQIIRDRGTLSTQTYTYTYTYDTNDRLTGLTTSGSSTTYTYDPVTNLHSFDFGNSLPAFANLFPFQQAETVRLSY